MTVGAIYFKLTFEHSYTLTTENLELSYTRSSLKVN